MLGGTLRRVQGKLSSESLELRVCLPKVTEVGGPVPRIAMFRRHTKIVGVLAYLAGLATVGTSLLLFHGIYLQTEDFQLALLPVLLGSFGVRWLLRTGRLYFVRSGIETRLRDGRSPVLYLRAFGDERELKEQLSDVFTVSFEERLTRILRYAGPFLTIGRPDEKIPTIGPARIYTTDEEWKPTVSRLVAESCLIVFQAGRRSSEGLVWELATVFKHDPFKPVLLAFPFDFGGVYSRRERYLNFKEFFERATGRTLPQSLTGTNYILLTAPHEAKPLCAVKGISDDPLGVLLCEFSKNGFERFQRSRRRWAGIHKPALALVAGATLAWGAALAGSDHYRIELSEQAANQEMCSPIVAGPGMSPLEMAECEMKVDDAIKKAAAERSTTYRFALVLTVAALLAACVCAVALLMDRRISPDHTA